MLENVKVTNIIPANDWWVVSIVGNRRDYIVEPLVSWAVVERGSNFNRKTHVEGLSCIADDGYVTLVEDTGAFRGYVRARSKEEALREAKNLYK